MTGRKERPGRVRRWPMLLIGAPAAVAVWSGWVGLGTLCGFGIVHPLPGIIPGFKLNTAITLPVGVEAYGAYALGAWLAPAAPAIARAFARRSAIGALLLGMLGQVSYHILAAHGIARAPLPVIVLVSCMPVVTLGFGAALTHLLRSGAPAKNIPAVPVRKAASGAAGVPAAATQKAPKGIPARGTLAEPSRRHPAPGTREGAPESTGTPNLPPATQGAATARRFRSFDELVREGREAEDRAGRRLGVKVLRAELACKYNVAQAVAQALHPKDGVTDDRDEVVAR